MVPQQKFFEGRKGGGEGRTNVSQQKHTKKFRVLIRRHVSTMTTVTIIVISVITKIIKAIVIIAITKSDKHNNNSNNNNNNNDNFSNNKCSSSKTNNIKNIDKSSNTVYDANVTIRRKKPNKKVILIITILTIIITTKFIRHIQCLFFFKQVFGGHCLHFQVYTINSVT